ncbi:MAG: QacE family quaternary ammonium compound efflux SMR transporter [Phycisphaeraceae bacterium]|nr:MAG: QacE family quaternary ammonium compound efflux SMR transporter [Phycisphaeraceae bacterium]
MPTTSVIFSPWALLVVAGALEVVWASMLKQTMGFTRLGPSLITLGAMIASFFLLSRAMILLPAGVSYAVWVGIGAVGTPIAAAVFLGERLSGAQILCLLLVIIGIIGLKVTTIPAAEVIPAIGGTP